MRLSECHIQCQSKKSKRYFVVVVVLVLFKVRQNFSVFFPLTSLLLLRRAGAFENMATPRTERSYHRFKASGQQFEVETKFSFIRPIGHGAYGVVMYV